jgi:hypothetical protein
MTLVALWLLAVGLADLVRGSTDAKRRSFSAGLVVFVTVLLVAVLGGFSFRGYLVSLVLVVVPAWWWVVASSSALRGRSAVAGPLTVLGATMLVLLLWSGSTPVLGGHLAGWYGGMRVPLLTDVPPVRFATVLGALTFLQVSSNIVVRLVLDGAGSSAPRGETSLRGGRVLGPMERTFIFALGLAGQLTAASIIVAAKGLLRFPEIQARRETSDSVDALTEYFLVGSMASWLLALAFLPLV